MAEKLTQEEANIRLAAAGLAMADIGQSVVQMAHMAAHLSSAGMEIAQEMWKIESAFTKELEETLDKVIASAQQGVMMSNAGHQFNWKCNDCGHKCDELAENGATDEQAYCPMCGSDDVAYIQSSADTNP